MRMTTTVAIYARQSLDKEEGIDRQITRCEREAARRGWTVSKVYRDNDVSAYKRRGAKTQWAQMLQDARSGRVTHLIAVDLDRLIRSIQDLAILIELGVKVLTVDGEIDLTTADGELRATLLAAVAQFETKRKSERQLRANESRVSHGRPVPGRRRFGFESNGIELRDSEAEVVEWIFRQAESGRSIRSVAIELEQSFPKPATGKEWTPRRVRDTLLNPAYVGKIRHRGVVFESQIVPSIINDATFSNVEAILKNPARRTSPGSEVKYLASGIARCGVCGSKMHYMRGYMCSASSAHVHIKREILETEIATEVFLWLADRDDEDVQLNNDVASALQDELREAIRVRMVIQDLATMPGADLADTRRRLADVGKEIDRIQTRLDAERGSIARMGILEAVRGEWWENRHVKEYTNLEEEALTNWDQYWTELPLERQREILRSTLSVTVNRGRTPERISIEWLSTTT